MYKEKIAQEIRQKKTGNTSQEPGKVIYNKKIPRMNLDYGYGTKNNTGVKEEIMKEEIEDRNRGENRIMQKPEMTEEELIVLVNRQKNGKAAGVDGVKAEAIKHIKNKKIRKTLLKGQ